MCIKIEIKNTNKKSHKQVDINMILKKFNDIEIATDLGETIINSVIKYPNLLIYNKNYFGRGIRININEKESSNVELKLYLPSPDYEVKLLYDLIIFITSIFEDFQVTCNKNILKKDKLENFFELLKEENEKSFKALKENKERIYNLKLARFDYYISNKDVEVISKLSLKNFDMLIRKIQEDNILYVATPTFRIIDGKDIGYYITTEKIRTILPRRLDYKDTYFNFVFNVPKVGKVVYDYNDFIVKLKKEDYDEFDIYRIKLKEKTLEEIQEIIEG